MSARIRAPVRNLDPGARPLDPGLSHYLTRVLRLRVGDTLTLFDPLAALEGDATIDRIDRGEVVVRIGDLRRAAVVATRKVTWVQGVAKGDKMDAVVRDATELGVTRFIPTLTVFSVVKLDALRGKSRQERWERIGREAARQCGRGDAPRVDAPCSWADALHAATAASANEARFCLYERATDPIGPPLQRALLGEGGLAFAAGPEGGLGDDEVEEAARNGWAIVSLGDRVLRTETVATAVLGAVRVLDVPPKEAG